jgi:hypothetical protein
LEIHHPGKLTQKEIDQMKSFPRWDLREKREFGNLAINYLPITIHSTR